MAIVVPIAAEFDSSGIKSAEASFASFGKTLTKSLQQAGKDARKAFAEIEDGADNSATAAQRLAKAISTSADKLDADLKASKAAADALAKALGPDFAAKAGQGGINRIVTDLNRAGISMQEITTDAEVLAAAIKKVDDVNLQQVTTQTEVLSTGVQKVNTQVTASGQVMASFSGQAVTELANVGGSVGAVASGLGQVVAQAVAGKVSIADFAKVAGPMLALSVILLEVKQVFADIKAAKAWNAAEVKTFTKALGDGANVSTAVRDRIDEVGGAFVQVNKQVHALSPNGIFRTIFGFGPPISKEVKDITADLVALGLKSAGVAKLVAGGAPAVDAYVAALTKAGVSSDKVTLVEQYLEQQLGFTTDAVKAQTVATEFGVNASIYQASAMDTTAVAAGAAAVAIEQKTAADLAAKTAADAAAEADRNQANAIDSVREALYKRNSARYASQDADSNARVALKAYNEAQEKANKTGKSADIEKANELRRDAERALNGAAAAASAFAGEQFKYADETTRANAETAAAVKTLQGLKDVLAPGGALTRTVLEWIFLLDKIPKDIMTRFGISFGSSVKPPPVSSNILDGWTSTFNNSGTSGNTTNITVNGAVDAVATANQINTITTRNNQRNGTN